MTPVTDVPVVVALADGQWRASRSGDRANADLLHLLASDREPPDGFRITRGAPLSVVGPERRIEVDQTNDSWVVGDSVVVKWITEPLVGPHPAPERLRRLAAAGFTAMPGLRGMVEWQTPDGFWVPVVTAVDLVPDATDGWTWCLRECRVALGVERGTALPFTRRLGALTASMHLALADSPTGPVADHGDYHVGQVLRTPDGELFVIDFDGNPTLPPEERVRHRPAAYDVAGMLVALENVGHVAQRYAPELSDADVVSWTEQVQEEFLASYRETADALLDPTLLDGFVLDQIRRELAYADSHLPRWRYVPEAALHRRGLS
jgi:maltokinase